MSRFHARSPTTTDDSWLQKRLGSLEQIIDDPIDSSIAAHHDGLSSCQTFWHRRPDALDALLRNRGSSRRRDCRCRWPYVQAHRLQNTSSYRWGTVWNK